MYQLTPSQLNLYQDCPRCFWVEIHEKVQRPAVVSPLFGGMDLILMKYTDQYRLKGNLPAELQKTIEGVFLPEQDLIKKWRNPKSALSFQDKDRGVDFSGTLDECVVRKNENGESLHIPLIFQTRGLASNEQNHDQHHQMKLDCYDLLLQKNGYQTGSTGYVVYYIPEEVRESGVVQFNVQVIQLVTESKRAMNLIAEVSEVLSGKMPEGGQNCEYCAWGNLGARLSRNSG